MRKTSIVLLMGIILLCSCKKEKINNLVGNTYECVSEYDFTERDIAYYCGEKINEIQKTNFYFVNEEDLIISTTFRMIFADGTISPHFLMYQDEYKYSIDRDICISSRDECYDIDIKDDYFILGCDSADLRFNKVVE